MLINPRFFPTLLIILDLCAAGAYATHGGTRKIIYWISAADLTAAVTY
jgi:hypothetical protein